MSERKQIVTTQFVKRFIAEENHIYYCPIDKEYLEDEFNHIGLESKVHGYKDALDIILDKQKKYRSEEEKEFAENAAKELFGLIHQRYIITEEGLHVMKKKYKLEHFGTCPRYNCNKTLLLPYSQCHSPNEGHVKLLCPCCFQLYQPPKNMRDIDGSHFGQTFATLFMFTYPKEVRKVKPISKGAYVPTIYGFELYDGVVNKPPKVFLIRKSFVKKREEENK